eukprot:2803212-Pleurochrysis_carterae.AAC.4
MKRRANHMRRQHLRAGEQTRPIEECRSRRRGAWRRRRARSLGPGAGRAQLCHSVDRARGEGHSGDCGTREGRGRGGFSRVNGAVRCASAHLRSHVSAAAGLQHKQEAKRVHTLCKRALITCYLHAPPAKFMTPRAFARTRASKHGRTRTSMRTRFHNEPAIARMAAPATSLCKPEHAPTVHELRRSLRQLSE